MRPIFILFLFLSLLIGGCSDTPGVEDLQKFAATETYPEDSFLDTVSIKRALVIVAHDDDDCAMAGTIAGLTRKGWRILQLSLTQHPVPGENRNPAHLICVGNKPLVQDGIYRLGLDTMKAPYLPIPEEEFSRQFLLSKVADEIATKINAFRPTVIFTLDNIKGGYGHPEHIFVSQVVLDLYNSGTISAKRIYQSVYTDHMEKEIVDTWLKARMEKWGYPHASTIANELYDIDGMPDPDVQINITGDAQTKMDYLLAYPEEVRKNLRKFIPYYEEFDAETYFSVFDREFFRVIATPQVVADEELQ